MIKLQYLGDGYKYSHKDLYGRNIKNIFTNMTAREFRFLETEDKKVAVFGANALCERLMEISNDFFNEEFDVEQYNAVIHGTKLITSDDWLALKHLGYLPVKIKAIRDGELVDPQTSLLHIEVTDSRFFWLGQYLETFISQTYWPLVTGATKSREIKKVFDKHTGLTSSATNNAWRAHDFGARGHQGVEGAGLIGQAHLLFNDGSDNMLSQYQLATTFPDYETAPIVNASEHSVMCSRGEQSEETLFAELLERYKDTLLALVIDGYDQDNFVFNVVPKFKKVIQKRKMPLILRPDSGKMAETMLKYSHSLANTFGYEVNEKGYKVINNVNLIWGDGCTDKNIDETLTLMAEAGYSLDNYSFGVGSYYYISSTRDTLSMAVKATAVLLDDGTLVNTKKVVKTDPSKASLDGLVAVNKDNKNVTVSSYEEFNDIDSRKTYFEDGIFFSDSWTEIIQRRDNAKN